MRHISNLVVFILIALFISSSSELLAKEQTLKVTSDAFTNGSTIPKEYTADGKDLSPSLKWSTPPAKTKSLALTCEDPDAPVGTWFHWIVYNIPPQSEGLSKNIEKVAKLKNGSVQGSNDFRKLGYNGPAPPKGPVHHYNFKVFALKKKLSLKPGATKSQFYKSIKGLVLAKGTLTGTYQRK